MLTLTFHGPYSFTENDRLVFHCKYAKSAGIYLWVKNTNKGNYISYVGETNSLAKRHREHLIGILGLNYGIFDPEKAKQGVLEFIWKGFWRDREAKELPALFEAYGKISEKVLEHLRIIDIYFAPTTVDTKTRKHIEGSMGWNLRKAHPEVATLYPADNHVGVGEKIGAKLVITSDEPICGLDAELDI